ncbi:MAG: hypothetical protein ACYS14_15435 [Planctomycetota bacterium]|jgi:hypothetical protein
MIVVQNEKEILAANDPVPFYGAQVDPGRLNIYAEPEPPPFSTLQALLQQVNSSIIPFRVVDSRG